MDPELSLQDSQGAAIQGCSKGEGQRYQALKPKERAFGMSGYWVWAG